MFGGLAMANWYLSTTAQTQYAPVPDDPTVHGPQEEVEATQIAQIEAGLREDLARRTKFYDVDRGPGLDKLDQDAKLEDAIKDDLMLYMKVSPGIQVRVDVLGFKNGRDRMPEELGLEITLPTTQAKFSRDVGAVALVMGRFITELDLKLVRTKGKVHHFEVRLESSSGGSQVLQIDWREARKFYRGSLSLEDFLDGMG